jgi:hypothetical protein
MTNPDLSVVRARLAAGVWPNAISVVDDLQVALAAYDAQAARLAVVEPFVSAMRRWRALCRRPHPGGPTSNDIAAWDDLLATFDALEAAGAAGEGRASDNR